MKRLLLNKMMLILLFLTGLTASTQAQMPNVAIRFDNPQFICPSTYCVDVQLKAETEGLWVYGINVRFFYDDAALECQGFSEYATGYGGPVDQIVPTVGPAGSGVIFGLSGPVAWINVPVELVNFDEELALSTTEWTKLFKVCFTIKDPNLLDLDDFCASLIWDLQENPPESGLGGGFVPGDDGVVITLVDKDFLGNSLPTWEEVVQFNWEYNMSGNSFGNPINDNCIPTTCGKKIPISNWSLFLAIGLMVVATLFIYRRRISS
jgi:hypothetical protein